MNDCEWLVTYWNFTISNGELVSYHIQMVSWIKNPSSSSMLGELGRPHNLYLSPPVDMLCVAKGPSPKQKKGLDCTCYPTFTYIYIYVYIHVHNTYILSNIFIVHIISYMSFILFYLHITTCIHLFVLAG